MSADLRSLALLAGVLLAPACTLHTALSPEQRLVALPAAAEAVVAPDAGAPWRPATAADFDGAYSSVEIRGIAAQSVLRIDYYFERSGSYSGAALIASDGAPSYQVVSGEWRLSDGRVCLGNGSPPALARVRGRQLELSSDFGVVVLEPDARAGR